MKTTHNMAIAYEDILVKVWRDSEGNRHSQGKRVQKNHPRTQAERRLWVEGNQSGVDMCRYFMETYNLSFTAAWDKLKNGRDPITTKLNWRRPGEQRPIRTKV